ncbi:MAG: PAS domain S-box protein [Gammaproteobacteria bacterium]
MNKGFISQHSSLRVKNYSILLLTAIYIASSALGNLLVFSPSDASSFWPAAGVGLAGLLIGGISLWPGIFLGDLIFNILKYNGTASVFDSLGWITIDAVGPTLQAVVGTAIIAKYLQGALEGKFVAVLKIYLVGVVMCCMISPTIGVNALILQGVFPSSYFASSWFSWWIGDSIGVMLFTPVILWFAYNIRNKQTGKYYLILPHIALTTAMLLYGIYWFHTNEREEFTNKLVNESEQSLSLFSERLVLGTNAIESVTRFITVQENINETNLSAYVEKIDELGVRAISWMPKVSHDSRGQNPVVPGFDTGEGFEIFSQNAEGEIVLSPDREVYFPIVFTSVEYLKGRFFGFDPSASELHELALGNARDNNEIILSGTFSRSFGDQATFVFYAPVFNSNVDADIASVIERRENLRGFVVGVIEPFALMSSQNAQGSVTDLVFTLSDGDQNETIFLNTNTITPLLDYSAIETHIISVFGRELSWVTYAKNDYWIPGNSPESRIFLFALLFVVMIISFLSLNFISRTRLVNLQVSSRTKELSLERSKLRQAMDIANITSWNINVIDRIVTMDDRGYAFLKTSAEIEEGYLHDIDKWLLRFVYKDDRECLENKIFEKNWATISAEDHEVEGRLRRRDGSLRHVIFRFTAQYDEAGEIVGLLGTAQDVTQRKQMMLALRESEEYSRSIIESSQDCIKVHDLDGVILSITDRGMQVMDIPDRNLVLNVNWITFWTREQDRKAFLIAMNEAREGRPGRFQAFAETMSGVPKWWDVNISAITNLEGKVVQLLSVSRDVTSERNSKIALESLNTTLEEEVYSRTLALANSERRYRSMFDSNPVPMWVYEKDTLQFSAVNQAAIDSYGYTREEFLSMTILDIQPESTQEQAERRHHRGAIRIDGALHLRKDASKLYVDITSREIFEGNKRLNLVLANDITDKLQANAELKKQQDMTRLILENLGEGVVACDSEGELILFNKSAREWHGTDPRSIPAETWGDYYGLYEADATTPMPVAHIPLMRAFSGEKLRNAEMAICKQGEAPRFVLASGEPLIGKDGEKVGAVVVMHDVSERKLAQRELEESASQLLKANKEVENERAKLAERVLMRTAELTASNEQLLVAKVDAEAASRAKSSFLAVMSHEIRTPMNGIVGMVDVLSHSNLDEQHAIVIKTIKDSAFSLLNIIDDVLDFSKIEASRMELERAPVNLVNALEGVVDTLSILSLDKHVSINVYVDPELPRSIWGDAKRLRQVLLNLLGNAIKFSSGRDEKPGVVKVSIESISNDKDRYSIAVQDNGIGMTADQISNLFTSFNQAETSTTRVFGGTGLGLAISKRLVELMDGDITVNSEYGHGSEFSIVLPLQAVNVLEGAASNDFHDFDNLHCILVEDDDDSYQILERYLTHAGASVTRKPSLSAAASHSYDNQNLDTVVVYNTGLTSPSSKTMQSVVSEFKGTKCFLLNSGRRRSPRVIGPGLVSMDDPFVRQYDFLHGVAVTAGRASIWGIEQVQDSLELEGVQAPSIEEAQAQNQLILVAEDDKTNQKVIMRQLNMLGYAAELAADGMQALAMWEKGQYACLLTDLHMPKMDGYALTKKVRESEATGVRMPILLLTANALSGEAEKAKILGIDEYLTKPLQLKVLSDALERWVPREKVKLGLVGDDSGQSVYEMNFDLKVLSMAIGGDRSIINEVLAEYLESTLQLRKELFTAGVDGETQRVSSLAHRLKGSSQIVGAIRLGALCGELEDASKSGDYTVVRQFIAQIDLEWEKVAVDIREAIAA